MGSRFFGTFSYLSPASVICQFAALRSSLSLLPSIRSVASSSFLDRCSFGPMLYGFCCMHRKHGGCQSLSHFFFSTKVLLSRRCLCICTEETLPLRSRHFRRPLVEHRPRNASLNIHTLYNGYSSSIPLTVKCCSKF